MPEDHVTYLPGDALNVYATLTYCFIIKLSYYKKDLFYRMAVHIDDVCGPIFLWG